MRDRKLERPAPASVYSSARASREAFVETRAREQVTRRRFTVEEFHRMGEAGILREDERVELIEGEIVRMNPIGSRHAACVRMLTRSVGTSLDDELLLDVQNPVRLDGGLEPQPDLAVIQTRDYRESLPGPEDVLLVIEVSDTTLAYDRNVKLPLYARANIREAWIVDLPNDAVERHNDPSEDGYRRMERAGRGRSLASEVLPNLTLQANAVLG
ncbi:MAG: Uma2 family endonuclease [Rubrobacter sp.]|nr:Uma2 family endonuclease [Rubrobacter sp.]